MLAEQSDSEKNAGLKWMVVRFNRLAQTRSACYDFDEATLRRSG